VRTRAKFQASTLSTLHHSCAAQITSHLLLPIQCCEVVGGRQDTHLACIKSRFGNP